MRHNMVKTYRIWGVLLPMKINYKVMILQLCSEEGRETLYNLTSLKVSRSPSCSKNSNDTLHDQKN